jgi:hypothetical protein
MVGFVPMERPRLLVRRPLVAGTLCRQQVRRRQSALSGPAEAALVDPVADRRPAGHPWLWRRVALARQGRREGCEIRSIGRTRSARCWRRWPKLPDTFRCVVVAVRHITKSKGGRAIYAGQGSIDYTATARSVLLAGSSAQDPGEHALLHIKSNVSVLGPAIGYRVDESGFSWTGESRLTAADLLAAETAADERAADEQARTFLRELLADGPLAARKVVEDWRKAGISEITPRPAKAREGVGVRKIGFQDGSKWLWSIL